MYCPKSDCEMYSRGIWRNIFSFYEMFAASHSSFPAEKYNFCLLFENNAEKELFPQPEMAGNSWAYPLPWHFGVKLFLSYVVFSHFTRICCPTPMYFGKEKALYEIRVSFYLAKYQMYWLNYQLLSTKSYSQQRLLELES